MIQKEVATDCSRRKSDDIELEEGKTRRYDGNMGSRWWDEKTREGCGGVVFFRSSARQVNPRDLRQQRLGPFPVVARGTVHGPSTGALTTV